MNRIVLTTAFFFTTQLSFAEPSLERITLVLTGTGCQAFDEHIEKALSGLVGVRAIDGRSVPGHLLVDVERGHLTGAELAHRIAALAKPGTSCETSVMESCITAGNFKLR